MYEIFIHVSNSIIRKSNQERKRLKNLVESKNRLEDANGEKR